MFVDRFFASNALWILERSSSTINDNSYEFLDEIPGIDGGLPYSMRIICNIRGLPGHCKVLQYYENFLDACRSHGKNGIKGQ